MMEETDIEIINKLGLHARAASKFATTATKFNARISVRKKGEESKEVDGKSIMSLMLLAAPMGTQLSIRCEGEEAKEALNAICELINNRFEEDE